jgi:hypothetical protein
MAPVLIIGPSPSPPPRFTARRPLQISGRMRASGIVVDWTSVNELGRAGLARRGGHYRVLVRPYLVLVGSYL